MHAAEALQLCGWPSLSSDDTRSSYQLWVCHFLLTKRPADGPQTQKVSVLEDGRPGPPRLPPHGELGPHSPGGPWSCPSGVLVRGRLGPRAAALAPGELDRGGGAPTGSEDGLTSKRDLDTRTVMEAQVPGAGLSKDAAQRSGTRPDAEEAAAGRWGRWPGGLGAHPAPRGVTTSCFLFISAQWAARVAETPFQRSAARPRPRGLALKPVSSPSLKSRTARGQRTDPASGRGRQTDSRPTSGTAPPGVGLTPAAGGPRRRAVVTSPHFLRQSHWASGSKAPSCRVTVVNLRVAATSGSTLPAAGGPAAPPGKPCEAGTIVGSFIRDK